MFRSLDALVRSTVIAATLCTPAVVYAENSSNKDGAYYIDPAKRRTKEERKMATGPPEAPADQPIEEPTPEYVQPVPPPPENNSGKGWAWAFLIGGTASIAMGVYMGPARAGCDSASNFCEEDHSVQYITIGGGTILAGLGLYELLSK